MSQKQEVAVGAGQARGLPSDAVAVALALAIHELATNAVKYGALSAPEGRVTVRSRVKRTGGRERLVLDCIESGRPPVTAPVRRGFGGRPLERGLAGKVTLDYRPEGLACRMDLPLKALEPVE